MKQKYIKFTILLLAIFFTGCNSHPRDKTHLDDIVRCGFGEEYVSGYTKSNGRHVDGYCREQN